MHIARAPVRVSLAGGGTDFADYWQRFGGLVISTTIAKYVYVVVSEGGAPPTRITSTQFGTFRDHPAGQLIDHDGALARAVLAHYGLGDRDGDGLELRILSEVPPGTGLGTSSATTVALVQALSALQRVPRSRAELAEEACRIEIDELHLPMGKQDQYAAAFGGLNAIEFAATGTRVTPLSLTPAVRDELEAHLMLFFTGARRDSKQILARQQEGLSRGGPTLESLHQIRRLADEMREALEGGAPDRVSAVLHESWLHKQRLASGITNERVDEAYEAARAHGALGGKITGAGGGGFLMLYCPLVRQEAVTAALTGCGLERMDFRFEREGVRLLDAADVAAMPVGRELISVQRMMAPSH